jgi:hypothetical protein
MGMCCLPHPHPASPSEGEGSLSFCCQIQSQPPAFSSPLRGRLGGGAVLPTELRYEC